MIDIPAGYTTVHALIRFTERYQARSIITGTLETYEAGSWIDPVVLDTSVPVDDPTSADAVWTDEAQTGTCFDFVYIPGSVVEVIKHWPA